MGGDFKNGVKGVEMEDSCLKGGWDIIKEVWNKNAGCFKIFGCKLHYYHQKSPQPWWDMCFREEILEIRP